MEDYHGISLYNDFISHVVSQLQSRFTSNENHSCSIRLLYLLPSHICKTVTDVSSFDVPRHYHQLLIFTRMIYHFMLSCFLLCMGCGLENGRKFHTNAFKIFDNISYPNIYLLLQLSLTLPITSCESKKSFGQLKFLLIHNDS